MSSKGMKYKVIFSLSLILLLFSLGNIIYLKKDAKRLMDIQFDTKKIIVHNVNNIIVSNLYKNEGNDVRNCNLMYYKELIKLSDITNKGYPVLVFRYSIFNCSTCVTTTLEKLKTHFSNLSTNSRIIYIYDDENLRVSENMFGKMPYVSSDREILGLPMEKKNMPFMFVLDSNLVVKHFFLYQKKLCLN